ncbi:hypothetical protein Afil01_02200 [Actinorhabdospora filicis]|uniref:Uncharacterized protein n=1 Tax=Actinorhabdospora filicis TaxID=1785913 RepID=A0A9W6W6Y7_9ACTN|nr:hypothetical protein [Actinorhabdospora filicis]GLZ75413.1 hypothetical protein Afil01_02200 [Actinorhabdospora filicis]
MSGFSDAATEPGVFTMTLAAPGPARVLAAATGAGRPVHHHTLGEIAHRHDDRVVLAGALAAHGPGRGPRAARVEGPQGRRGRHRRQAAGPLRRGWNELLTGVFPPCFCERATARLYGFGPAAGVPVAS